MGATLTGTRISDTYDSLLKATDNGIITSSAKQITDGVGTNTPLYISTTRIGIGVSPTTTFQVAGNSKIGGDLTVTGDLLVEGTTTTVDTDTLSVKDPLIIVGNDNNTSDLVDLGFYGLYDTSGSQDLYAGLYRSASTTKFHLFKDLQEEPTTTVNTSGTGYAVASLVANLEGNVTGNLIGSVTGGTFSGTLLSNVAATTQSANDNSTKVATTAYVDNQVGLYDTLSEVLANGNTSGANDIIMADSQKVNYGTDSDLQIYHDGSNGFIKNTTGSLNITDSIIALRNQADNENMLYARENAQVELYYDNSIKLATTSTGIYVTGSGVFTQSLIINTGEKLFFDNGGDCYISEDTTGRLKFVVDGSEFMRLGDGIPDTITFYKDSTFAGTITGTSANLTTSGTVLSLDRTGGATALVELKIGGTVEGYLGANSTKSLIVFNESASEKLSVSNGGNLITTGSGTFGGDIKINNSTPYLLNNDDEILAGSDTGGYYFGLVGSGNSSKGIQIGDHNSYIRFDTDDSERMRIDSSGTIIGTGTYSAGGSIKIFEAQRSGGAVASDWSYDDATTDMSLGTSTSHSFSLKTNNTRALTIDTSQNSTFAGNVTTNTAFIALGSLPALQASSIFIDSPTATINRLGVTGANTTTKGTFVISQYSSDGSLGADTVTIDSSGNSTFAGKVIVGKDSSNALEVFSSGDTEIGFSYATQGNIYAKIIGDITTASPLGGEIAFQTATGGALTERMRIDSSGNVKVGRSSGYGSSRIQSFINNTANFASSSFLAADSTNMAAGVGGEIVFIGKYATGVDDYAFYGGIKGFKENATDNNTACALGFYTRPTGTLPTERMRITSGGQVQIGNDTTVTPELLTVQAYSHNQAFSGKSSSSNYIWFLRNENNSGRFQLYNSSSTQTIEMTGANGNINIAGTLTEGSDVRIKENIKPLKSQLEIVNKLNPVSYNKIGFEENEIGFIAQEVEEFLPELVSEDKEGMKSIAYSKMNTILVKAIQELKAEVDKLKQECKCK